MSKYDQGKHVIGHTAEGEPIVSKKRRDPQRPPKSLARRQADYDAFVKGVNDRFRGGYHKPGTQNKAK